MLATAQAQLGWPPDDMVFDPPGSGAAVIADLARAKIQQRIYQLDDGKNARVGILTLDPASRSTQAPLALVCEFPKPVSQATLRELHRLAWNFSRSPLLISIEPHRLRAFSCCEKPEREERDEVLISAEICEAEYLEDNVLSMQEKASSALHWLNISSGMFQRRYPDRFNQRYTADNTLLENLNAVREKLLEVELSLDLAHDLLARLIFIQFLFQRRDSNGIAALNANQLTKLYQQGILSKCHKNLGDILGDYQDTYALFRYLNDRFNGDLFPGKADTEEEREKEWRREMQYVRSGHLKLLRDFVTGEMQIRSGQLALWPMYSFDTIPLEFVSSIYEAFVTKRKGTVYTPVHLVDFVLDGVLPWEGTHWDLKILDPACGSGIFLVRAYQRLVHRWKNANPNAPIRTETLKRLLTRNLTGVDIDQHAMRVASFSLYLAMCDELDPRHYWQQIRFPKLRNVRLICADFFSEDSQGLNTERDKASYDLVVGNPPWGKNQIKAILAEFGSDAAEIWADKNSWPVHYGDAGTLFVAKALRLVKADGVVSLLQPTQTLLNQSGNAVKQREKLFSEYQAVEVVNLSALRFGLFKKAVGPASIITIKPRVGHKDYSLTYMVLKPSSAADNDYRFVVDPYDVHEIPSSDAANSALVWTALTWGGPRDLALLNYLFRFPTIASYEKEGKLKSRWGIVRGNRKRVLQRIVNESFFSARDFPANSLIELKSEEVSINADPHIHDRDSTSFEAFEAPQMLVKRSWRREAGRFRAVKISPNSKSVYCSNSYVTVSAFGGDKTALDNACLALNSRLAIYYLLLTSAQFSNYRDTTNVSELLSVPCPSEATTNLSKISSYTDIDREIYKAFKFKESEQALVDDLFDITLPFFKDGDQSIARQATQRATEFVEDELMEYLQWFLRVLNATFAAEGSISATLFKESGDQNLPVRLVAIHLDSISTNPVTIQSLNEGELVNQLMGIYRHLSGEGSNGPVIYRRVARVFDTVEINGKLTPTIFITKPDEKRYWTRSIAMRDADEVVSEIMIWKSHQQGKK